MRKWFSFASALCLTVGLALTGCSSSTTDTNSTANTGANQEKPAQTTEMKEAFELPSGDVSILIPVAAGGGTDLTWRTVAESTKDILGRNIVVVNKPGAGGSVGLAEASRLKADGLHLSSYTSEIYTLPIFQQTAFTPEDFKPVILVNFDPAALVVPADSPYKTIEEFIAAAKENPGGISVGNSGFGNIWHLSAAAFAEKAGIELKQVPFEGAAPTVQAALGGHINAFVASPPEVASQVEAGQLRILAVMSDERLEKFPDVPTLKDINIDFSVGTWRGLGVPKDTPDEAVKIIHDAIAEGIQSESFKSFMQERGMGIKYMNTEDFTKFAAEQRPQSEELAKKIKETQK